MSPKRILIVEDNDDLRYLWTDALDGYGYEVLAVNDGALALDEIPRFRPDLILLDLIMPMAELDGVALLSRLSASAMLAAVPVIVISGLSDPLAAAVAPETARTLGIVSIVAKPVDVETLRHEIDRIVLTLPSS